MPDTPDPELDARLHNAFVTQTNAKAAGLNPGTPEWDTMTRGRVSPTPPSAIDSLLGAPTGTGEAIRTMGQNALAGGVHGAGDLLGRWFGHGGAPNAGASLVHQPSSPEAAALLQQTQLDPHNLVTKGLDATESGIGHTAGATAADIFHQARGTLGDVGQIAQVAAPALQGLGAVRAGVAGEAAAPTANLLPQGGNVIPRAIAGSSGQVAKRLYNQQEANNIAAVEARVPEGTPMSNKAVVDAQQPMHEVFNRFGEAMPKDMTLPKDITDDLAALDKAEPQLANIPGRPSIDGPIGGQQLVDKWRQLKSEGSAQIGADGDNRVVQNQIGKAKLDLAERLLNYGSDQLPEGSPVDKQHLLDANQAYSKSYAVLHSMGGSDDVNAQQLGRASAAQPGKFTDGLKVIADHANNNPTVAGPGNKVYNSPNMLTDIIGEGGHAPWNPVNALTGVAGLRPLSRGALTNWGRHPSDFVDSLRAAQPSLAEKPMEGLTPPPGTVFDQLQHEMSVPQGPGPNPDLKMTPPPGNARPVLSTQTDMVSPQGPGGVNKNLPQSPPGTGGLQPGLFDQIEAPPSAGPRNMPLGGEIGGNYVEPGSKVYSTGPQNDPHSMLSVSPRDDGSLHVSSVHTKPEAQGQGLASQHLADAASDAAADGTPLHSDVVNSPSMVRTLDSAKRNGLVDFDIKHPEAYQRGLNAPKSKAPIKTPTPLVENIRPAAAPSDYPGGFRRDRGMIQDGANYRAPSISDQIAGP